MLLLMLYGLLATRHVGAATLSSGFSESLVASGLQAPTAMAFAPDGRLFVCEQAGNIRVIKNGELLAEPFLSMSVDSWHERGLLGIAFDPDFASNQHIYVYYTNPWPSHNRVVRFTANGDVVVPGSQLVLLEIDELSNAGNHNGGAMHFGNDGKLYVAVGDNAYAVNAQRLYTLKGKMLRLNKDGTIPSDNPFYASAEGKNRAIWALGLRNPYTFDIQRSTGRIFINDVGQSSWEEINDGAAGANYGWPDTEGATSDPRFVSPVFAYTRSPADIGGCAITGGAWYDPETVQFPSSFQGKYFFADLCSGWIRVLDPSARTASPFAQDIQSPVDLKVDSAGRLFYLSYGGGSVYRIEAGVSDFPIISSQPASQTVAAGNSATFQVTATGKAPFSYQWLRNGMAISGATTSSYSFVTSLDDSGARFRVRVTNAAGAVLSDEAILTVNNNQLPQATIISPIKGALYKAGTTILFKGSAKDAEDGALSASAFSWKVVFHHATHTHPFLDNISNTTEGSFTIPTRGETGWNVWYRIYLTVRDSGGANSTVYRDIYPQLIDLQLRTNLHGPRLTLDGEPRIAPVKTKSIVGMIRSVGAPSPQTINGVTYEFVSWSDGGARTHEFETPTTAKNLTANFRITSDLRPRIAISTPRAGSASLTFLSASGTATPGVSGKAISEVTVALRRESDKAFWTGSQWLRVEARKLPVTSFDGKNWTKNSGLPYPGEGYIPQGAYTFYAYATDTAGITQSTYNRFVIDRTLPTVAITTPTAGATLSSLASIAGTTADNTGGSGVVQMRLALRRNTDKKFWNGSSWYSTSPIKLKVSTFSGTNWMRNIKLPSGASLPSGTYVAYAYATDKAGNEKGTYNVFTIEAAGVQAEADNSTVILSSAAGSTDGTIRLVFAGELGQRALEADNYTLVQNGVPAEVISVQQLSASTIVLHADGLAAGGRLELGYKLLDMQGRNMTGTATMVVR